MIRLKNGTFIRPETGEFSLVTGDPKKVGDEALLRTAWREVVRVMLLPDERGRLWLVQTHRQIAPIARPLSHPAPRLRSLHRKLQLVNEAIRLRKELDATLRKLKGQS